MLDEFPTHGINNVVFLKLLLCDQLKCTKEELDFEAITSFSLEHRNLVKINCLWPMCNLRKLNLSSNAIKRIENVDSLVHLEDLDLSFNEISTIENLHTLKKLRRLTLYANRVVVLENMENLKNLEILNVGANRIHDQMCPFYLAQFKNLRCLVLSENPCYEKSDNEIDDYLLALMPQLTDLNNRRITDKDRYLATTHYKMKTKGLKKFGMGKLDALRSKKQKKQRNAIVTIGEKKFAEMFADRECFLELTGEGDVFRTLNEKFKKQMIDLFERAYTCSDGMKKKFEHHQRTFDELETESIETQKRFIRDVGDCLHDDREENKRRIVRNLRKNLLAEECDLQHRFEILFDDLEKKLRTESIQQTENLNDICLQLINAIDSYVDSIFKLVASYFRKTTAHDDEGSENASKSEFHQFWKEVDLEKYENTFRQFYVNFIDDLKTRITTELNDWKKQFTGAFQNNLVRHRKAVAKIINAVAMMSVQ